MQSRSHSVQPQGVLRGLILTLIQSMPSVSANSLDPGIANEGGDAARVIAVESFPHHRHIIKTGAPVTESFCGSTLDT
jgi:hypothetical protein